MKLPNIIMRRKKNNYKSFFIANAKCARMMHHHSKYVNFEQVDSCAPRAIIAIQKKSVKMLLGVIESLLFCDGTLYFKVKIIRF